MPIFEILSVAGFNTQPPEGGWFAKLLERLQFQQVSTHSRPKAAGTMTRVQEAALMVSTHSRPKAAGISATSVSRWQLRFNTQPPEGGWFSMPFVGCFQTGFQHTAARRRLAANTSGNKI